MRAMQHFGGIVWLAALGLAVACGSEEVEVERVAPRPAVPQIPIEDIEVGENSVPADFPEDVPVFSGSDPAHWASAGGMGALAVFLTDAQPPEVYAFYEKELVAQGWTIESQRETPRYWLLNADKAGRKTRVSIAPREGRTEIGIAVTPAP